MAKLVYTMLMSLDGYIADENGEFDWAEPDDEVLAFVNDLERLIGTYLYGRRMYEMMTAWENPDHFAVQSSYIEDFAAIWQAADKSCTPGRLPRRRRPGRGSSRTSTRKRSDG